MNRNITTIIFTSAAVLAFSASFLHAAGQASNSIDVSLTIASYIKCTVNGDEMTIMTNSYQPVFILEDNTKVMPEKAVFGQLATIKIKNNSSYTILSGI